MKEMPLLFIGPKVSKASGMKVYELSVVLHVLTLLLRLLLLLLTCYEIKKEEGLYTLREEEGLYNNTRRRFV